MKKKKLLFVSLLLLIIAIPFTITFGKFDGISLLNVEKVSADSGKTVSGYQYRHVGVYASSFNGGKVPRFCVSSNACHSEISDRFWLHAAYKDGTISHGYCLHINKTAKYINGNPPSLKAHIYTDNFPNDVLKNRSGQSISNSQRKLLQALLASGYKYEKNSFSESSISDSEARKIFVKQILVWEIIEGGRTTFTTEAPNVYNESDSAYKKVIKSKDEYKNLYTKYREDAMEYLEKEENGGSASVFKKDEYTMSWNNNLGKYTTGDLSGLGEFGDCKSNNDNVKFTTSGGKINVSTSKPNQTATITCTYKSNGGKNEWIYYEFVNVSGTWQDIINGNGGTTITKSFKVKSEGVNVKITKKDDEGKALDNTKFTLTKSGSSSISLDGNGSSKVLAQSGAYTLKEIETSVPHGYEKIPDTSISFDIASKKVTACTGKGTDSKGNVTCQGGKITVKFSNDTFELIIIDTKKSLFVRKLDGVTKKGINGATFEVYTGNNFATQVKFTKKNNVYTYNTSGSETKIVGDYSSYSLNMLPVGTYKIVEKAVPAPYILAPAEADRTKYVKIESGYESYECTDSSCSKKSMTVNYTVTAYNYTTKVDVKKIGNGGKTLPGVKFVLLNGDKTKYVKSTLAAGKYNFEGLDSNIENATIYVTDSKGLINVNNLPVGDNKGTTYYFKEIETIDPYVLPEGDDAYTQVTIEMKADGPRVNSKTSSLIEISNATKVFNFYKVDENGNYLAGGKYKLQKYNVS